MSAPVIFLLGVLAGAALAICATAMCRIAADADEAESDQ